MATDTTKSLRHLLNFSMQVVIVFFCKLLFWPTTRATATPQLAHMHNQPYLVIGNHRRAFDPFVICSMLPWRTSLRILPIGFMSHNVFYDSPLRPFMWLAGCFPARNPRGKHAIFGVDGATKMLGNGFSVFIFPEGTRIYKQPRGTAHSGIIRIHKAVPNVPFILAHIEYNKGLKAWPTGNRRVVKYGLVEHPNYDNPEQVMDDVYAL